MTPLPLVTQNPTNALCSVRFRYTFQTPFLPLRRYVICERSPFWIDLGRVRILLKIRLKINFDIFSIVNLPKFNFNRVLMSIRTRPCNFIHICRTETVNLRHLDSYFHYLLVFWPLSSFFFFFFFFKHYILLNFETF
jgi:hypothetical protein